MNRALEPYSFDKIGRQPGEQDPHENQQPFRLMADAAPALIWISGPDKACRWFNKRWLEFVGRPMEQELGDGWSENVHPADFDRCLQTYHAAFDQRQAFSMEYRLRRYDGVYRWVLDNGIPLYESKTTFVGYVGSCIDITERKRAEDALRESHVRLEHALAGAQAAARAKDQFLAALSHELRTPLTPILLMVSELQADATVPAPVREQLMMIQRNVEIQARMVDELLDLSRIAHDKLQLQLSVIDAHQTVQGALEVCGSEATHRQLAVICRLEAQRHQVRGDAARLQQVFWNLFQNAIKFTPTGGKITISSRNTGTRLAIEITDTGRGIEKDLLRKIFEPFEQGERQGKDCLQGLGLGLAIAKRIINAHGGTISATSAGPSQGASFTVELDTEH